MNRRSFVLTAGAAALAARNTFADRAAFAQGFGENVSSGPLLLLGTDYYPDLGAHLEPADLARVLLTLIAANGIENPIKVPRGVEVTTRKSDRGTLTYLLNHTALPQTVQVDGSVKDVLTASSHSGTVSLGPYGIRVLQSATSAQ